MDLTLVRSATLEIGLAGRRLLLDPMLDPAGAVDAIPGTPSPRRNPLVDLPRPAEDIASGVDALLVTHLHNDHLDATAVRLLDAGVPVACQPGDEQTLRSRGFSDVRPVDRSASVAGVDVARTGGRHGTGEIGERMGRVSGFVVRADGEPLLYVAGDTIWCDEVASALSSFSPDLVVVNAGEARFLEGEPIIMDAADVIETARAVPDATIVAVHLEALNHCVLSRASLRAAVDAAGVGERVLIPADGETMRFVAAG
jgi:L-ascorbate metabolism protein UlaG (beta-lactamase superfamily)